MLTPASTNEKVTDRGLPYMFRLCGRDDDQAPAAAKFLKEQLNAKTVFIVDDKTTYSQGLADGVSKAAKALGIKVVEHDHVNQGDKDFAAVLTKAKQANADIFYMSLQGFSPAALMTLQAKRHRPEVPDRHPGCRVPAQVHGSGQGCSRGRVPDLRVHRYDHPEYKNFEKLYVPKYGAIAAYATYAYDAATVLLQAIKNAGSTDPAKIKAEIMKMDFRRRGQTHQVQAQRRLRILLHRLQGRERPVCTLLGTR
jgi:branched-chain amino acid transport system substrate-binding protein